MTTCHIYSFDMHTRSLSKTKEKKTKQKLYIFKKSYDIYKIIRAEIESFSCFVFAFFRFHLTFDILVFNRFETNKV